MKTWVLITHKNRIIVDVELYEGEKEAKKRFWEINKSVNKDSLYDGAYLNEHRIAKRSKEA